MAENLMVSSHKSTNPTFRDNYDRIFRSNQDVPFPEEIRDREVERRLKELKKEQDEDFGHLSSEDEDEDLGCLSHYRRQREE